PPPSLTFFPYTTLFRSFVGNTADRAPVGEDRLTSERDQARIGERQTHELRADPHLFLPHEGLTADEVALVELDAESQARFPRRVDRKSTRLNSSHDQIS